MLSSVVGEGRAEEEAGEDEDEDDEENELGARCSAEGTMMMGGARE